MHRPAIVAMLLAALALAGCSSGGDAESARTTGVDEPAGTSASLLLDPEEFASYMETHPDAPVVNVHIPYEGHIEGTDAFVPFEEIEDWADLPEDPTDPIVIYCRSGRMSGIAADTLTEMGYTEVIDLNGGMNAWTDAGFELLTDDPDSSQTPE